MKLKCTKTAKNEQAKKLLANFDLNSSQKCNKMISEAEEEEGRKRRLVLLCFSLVKAKDIIYINHK